MKYLCHRVIDMPMAVYSDDMLASYFERSFGCQPESKIADEKYSSIYYDIGIWFIFEMVALNSLPVDVVGIRDDIRPDHDLHPPPVVRHGRYLLGNIVQNSEALHLDASDAPQH